MKINLPVMTNKMMKENYSYNYERERAGDTASINYKEKANDLINSSVQTIINDDTITYENSKELNKINRKVNRDLTNLAISIFSLSKDLKLRNKSTKNDEDVDNK